MSGKATVQSRLGTTEADFFTVGYEKRKVEDLFVLMRSAGVRCLADVRDTPWSRIPDYRKNALEDKLEELGIASGYHIRYISMPALGNPPENRKSDRSPGAMLEFYRDRILARTREIQELYEIIKNCKTVLLCYEADPADCHRSVLAAILAEQYGLTYADLGVSR